MSAWGKPPPGAGDAKCLKPSRISLVEVSLALGKYIVGGASELLKCWTETRQCIGFCFWLLPSYDKLEFVFNLKLLFCLWFT